MVKQGKIEINCLRNDNDVRIPRMSVVVFYTIIT